MISKKKSALVNWTKGTSQKWVLLWIKHFPASIVLTSSQKNQGPSSYCWWLKSCTSVMGSLSHYLQGFIHPLCRISSINIISIDKMKPLWTALICAVFGYINRTRILSHLTFASLGHFEDDSHRSTRWDNLESFITGKWSYVIIILQQSELNSWLEILEAVLDHSAVPFIVAMRPFGSLSCCRFLWKFQNSTRCVQSYGISNA